MPVTNSNKYSISLLFFPLVFLSISCVCTTHIKELTTKNEELKTLQLELQYKGKTISDLFDRLSKKDREIGKLTDELHAAHETIEELKSNIEKLREVDVQMEEKKEEVDNRIEETITTSSPEATPEVDSKSTEE